MAGYPPCFPSGSIPATRPPQHPLLTTASPTMEPVRHVGHRLPMSGSRVCGKTSGLSITFRSGRSTRYRNASRWCRIWISSPTNPTRYRRISRGLLTTCWRKSLRRENTTWTGSPASSISGRRLVLEGSPECQYRCSNRTYGLSGAVGISFSVT
ncbi:MAG: hypothetical protein BWY82_00490 [Verrucomicrobia bacterium ADurb.Bin474]|nr:MAG: hypothetical protein BWY82_00490 [Verrucomicrobia bacterium ADurb.Bin474]